MINTALHQVVPFLLLVRETASFQPNALVGISPVPSLSTRLYGTKPKRLEENAPGILYVNDKCINCSACSQFAPETFKRSSISNHHVVHQQPPTTITNISIDKTVGDITDDASTDFTTLQNARAAMSACPVSAIRSTTMEGDDLITTNAHSDVNNDNIRIAKKAYALNPSVNNLPLPFPRVLWEEQKGNDKEDNGAKEHSAGRGVWFLGHHCEGSFGAMPYLVKGRDHNDEIVSVIVDVPRCNASSMKAVKSLLPPANNNHNNGKVYMLLTHVDDTADHQKWKEVFPEIKRIFHSGDLGEYNWIGDKSLEDVEILLHEQSNVEDEKLIGWSLDGDVVDIGKFVNVDESSYEKKDPEFPGDFLILHTPGHTPGSISLLFRPQVSTSSENETNENTTDKRVHGTIFTGDTLAYTTREGGHLTGFPLYTKEGRSKQVATLRCIQNLSPFWNCIAPGHGHVQNYSTTGSVEDEMKQKDIDVAVEELLNFSGKGAYK